jgi:hypothetical protein
MSQTAVTPPIKPKSRLRWPAVLAILFVVWLSFVGFIDWAMHQPPDKFGRVMKHMPFPAFFLFPFETMWNDARKGTLGVGSEAPDFNLEAYDKSGNVQLASFRGKQPVVLVFGSYT